MSAARTTRRGGSVALVVAGLFIAVAPACFAGSTYKVTPLVSDGAVPAPVTDDNLKNPWGLAYGPSGPFWVANNKTGTATLYNGAGEKQPLVVTLPAANPGDK